MIRVWVCVVLGPMLAVASWAAGAKGSLVPAEKRTAVANFDAKDLDGGPIRLSGLHGKVVLLNFWATTCGGCKVELPWLIEFDSKYRHQGLITVGVAMYDEGESIVRPFLARNGIRYPIVIGNEALARRYGLIAMPMTLLIDKRGKVALTHVGIIDRNIFESDIRALMSEKGGS